MMDAIRSEYRKFFSTRMWWVLALVMVLYLGMMGALMGAAMTAGPATDMDGAEMMMVPEELAQAVYSLANPLGYAFPLIVGSLMFTGEFRHRTITPTLLADPNRTRLLLAKVVVAATVGLVFGLLAVGGMVAAAAPILQILGDGAMLGNRAVLEVLVATVVVFAIWTVLGLVLGGLIVNQVAAIVLILVFTQLVEPLLRIGLMVWEPTQEVSKYLPGAAGDAIVGGGGLMGMGVGDEGLSLVLDRPVGFLVMLAYILVLAGLARIFTLRRDVS